MINIVKKLRRIAGKIISFTRGLWLCVMSLRFLFLEDSSQRYILIGAPDHGNSGDMAIAVAIKQFIACRFPEALLIDIDILEYRYQISAWQKQCKPQDVFLLIGGGNFGNQYMRDENIRRDVIARFPNNKIVLFPQSMYFTEDECGEKELDKSKEIYNQHKHLTLFARDVFSCEAMKREFTCGVFLTPDIVFSMVLNHKPVPRVQPLLCLRNDLERTLSEQDVNKIIRELEQRFSKPLVTDTVVKYHARKTRLSTIVNQKLNEFERASIVVTDRLHGMIFAAITATPCIAFPNYNHKIEGIYQWVKNLEYIRFAASMDEYIEFLKELKPLLLTPHPRICFDRHYDELERVLRP